MEESSKSSYEEIKARICVFIIVIEMNLRVLVTTAWKRVRIRCCFCPIKCVKAVRYEERLKWSSMTSIRVSDDSPNEPSTKEIPNMNDNISVNQNS